MNLAFGGKSNSIAGSASVDEKYNDEFGSIQEMRYDSVVREEMRPIWRCWIKWCGDENDCDIDQENVYKNGSM